MIFNVNRSTLVSGAEGMTHTDLTWTEFLPDVVVEGWTALAVFKIVILFKPFRCLMTLANVKIVKVAGTTPEDMEVDAGAIGSGSANREKSVRAI
jgi:hypothetical protein